MLLRREINFIFVALLYLHNGYAISSASVSTQAPINFGIYNPRSPNPSDGIGRFVINCSGDAPISYSIALTSAKNIKNGIRQMSNGETTLNYYLYTDAARTLVWGDGASGTATIHANNECTHGSSYQHVIYARIPAGQKNIAVGTYSDTIMMTLNY